MKGFPYVPMEVVERSQYDGGTYFLIQTKEDRNGWEVAEVRPDIPWQLKVAQLLAAAPELLADLIDAAAQLRTYEALHRAKGTDDSTAKAEVNAALAARFEATIARARGEA